MYIKAPKAQAKLPSIFRNAMEFENYRYLVHFVIVQKVLEPIPGTISFYIMTDRGVAVGTNALCINQWLELHGLRRRAPVTELRIKHKLAYHPDALLDNRTPESIQYIQITQRVHTTVNTKEGMTISPDTIKIWRMITDGMTTKEIAAEMGVPNMNIYYHMRRMEAVSQETIDNLIA